MSKKAKPAKKTAAKAKKTAKPKPAKKTEAKPEKGERKGTSKAYILARLAKDGFTKERPPKEWAEKVAAEVRAKFEGRTTQASDIYFVYYRQDGRA